MIDKGLEVDMQHILVVKKCDYLGRMWQLRIAASCQEDNTA